MHPPVTLGPKESLDMLAAAAVLAVSIGIAHSYHGERYILTRLFRRPLPPLFGDDWFTKQTLRFAWHITTVAWCGFAAILLSLNAGTADRRQLLMTIGGTFGITALFPILASRGKHLSWIVFGTIAAICFLAANVAPEL